MEPMDMSPEKSTSEEDVTNTKWDEARAVALGFKPQRENPYNRLLPYADELDKESNEQLAEIKANLGRVVQLRDIKFGATHWLGQLSKYIRLYGLKFSKSDHLTMIHLIFEMLVIPDLDYSMVHKLAVLLTSLLKKKELISRKELTLPWRPLYKLLEGAAYSPYESHGLVLLPSNIESALKNLVHACRTYFPIEATQEILDQWRPLLCPFDASMVEAVYFLECFLPTEFYPEEHHAGYMLWFTEFRDLWLSCQNITQWDSSFVSLFSRLAHDCVGYIDWESCVPKLFMDILRSFNLPVGSTQVTVVTQNHGSYDPTPQCVWIASILGSCSSVQVHLNKLFKALESFYHPSNHGQWNLKLMKFLAKLPECVISRVHREKYWKSWIPRPPPESRLTDRFVTEFVTELKDVLYIAMFSKTGSNDAASALQNLACLRPELIIPSLLNKTYPALETLTEPHRLFACLQCIVAVSRSMVGSPRWYPEGRMHVVPLLTLILPGIDPNDIKKSLMTFHLISSLSSLVPIKDCSDAAQFRKDLSEEELDLCSATAQFEDVVLQFLDRAFALIDNSVHQQTRSDSTIVNRLNQEEEILEVCLLSATYSILHNCSLSIYMEALQRLHKFATESVFEIKVAGRFTSNLVQAAARSHPDLALKKFVPGLCARILSRTTLEDISKEEHIDNEFLWDLKLLSEVISCDGSCITLYAEDLISVLQATLHVKCKEVLQLANNLLRNLLKQITMIYTLNCRNSLDGWKTSMSPDEPVPIREWGRAISLKNLTMDWHVPNEKEKELAHKILVTFLVPELKTIALHVSGTESLDRDNLLQSLAIIHHCLLGAGGVLPHWSGQPVHLVDSCVDLTRFSHVANCNQPGLTIDGENVRLMVANSVRPLLGFLISTSEDDTKSLIQIIKIINSLMYFHGTQKEEFEGRWKNRHYVKRFMENRLLQKKQHIKPILVDRVHLQHEMRTINQSSKTFSDVHLELFTDLMKLSLSRYMQVRRTAQSALGHGFHVYAYSYRPLLDDIVKYLKDDESGVEHHQLKGALYLVLGQNKRSLVARRSWDISIKLWPALIKVQHCEKPSVVRLYEDIIDKLHKDIETTELNLVVHDRAIEVASEVWSNGSQPSPSLPTATAEELFTGREKEAKRNASNVASYNELVQILVSLANSGKLPWKFYQVSLEMLALLVRCDIRLPADAVQLFTRNMIHQTLNIRKICLASVSAILKQQKRSHPKIVVDPYKFAPTGVTPSADTVNIIRPGDRPDNAWLQYTSASVPRTQEAWNQSVFVDKTHWGYYTWPREMLIYGPASVQPPLGRSASMLTDEERVIYECFIDADFLDQFIKYMSLEENKGRDKFHAKFFIFFKGLFRNYDDTVLERLKPHVERLVADTAHGTHETSQRLAAEIIAGLIRGCKHWTFEKTQAMWTWLVPVMKQVLCNFSVDSIRDWGTCIATCSANRDPRKIGPLLELLMDNPLNSIGGSFGDSSRLYLLQGALAQQEWRVAELLHKLYAYLLKHLDHPYKNVRDRIGSTLVNLFLYDVHLPNSPQTLSPIRVSFLAHVRPQLDSLLQSTVMTGNTDESVTDAAAILAPAVVVAMNSSDVLPDSDQDNNGGETGSNGNGGDDEERKAKITLFKTILKWIQGTYSRMFQCTCADIFNILPVACLLECETKDTELRRECITTLTYMAVAQLGSEVIQPLLDVIKQVSMMSSWHARVAMLAFIQVAVFYNIFLLQAPDVVSQIKCIVLQLLCDEQLEVRELAGVTLGGFLHCGYFSIDAQLMIYFKQLSSTAITKKRRSNAPHSAGQSVAGSPAIPTIDVPSPCTKMEITNGDHSGVSRDADLVRRHAGVIGLSACILAFPYSVPEFVPKMLMDVSDHLNDPQPIQMTVKKTLATFKRTHTDSWHDHRLKFTDDQLAVLTDLLVSPNYYA